jgi:hypothetical protein
LLRAVFFVCLLVCAAPSWRAQSSASLPFEWNEAVHALAEKIARALPPSGLFSIDVKDLSGSAPVASKDLGQALGEQLGAMGARQAEGRAPDCPVELTISKGVEGFLLVAELTGTDTPPVIVVPVANPAAALGPPSAVPTLERKIVWQQTSPILDFAEEQADQTDTLWYLLEPERIEVYEFSKGALVLHDAKTLGRAFASRDPRGEIVPTDATHVTTYLAGFQCQGAWSPTFRVQCTEVPDQLWPMGGASWVFESPRNYFSGNVIFASGLERKFPAFYAAASPSPGAGGESNSLWIVAGVDGQAQLFGGTAEATSTFAGWGSDIVTLAPACAGEWLVLGTGTGDWTEPDHLQLYEVKGFEALAVGQPLEVPGPVLTLWPAEDGKSARVVLRNLETGDYEASMVTVACSD